MPSGYYRAFSQRDSLLLGSPSASFIENFSHDQITTDLVASLVTQVMTSVAVPLIAGDIITNMSVISGATALATPSHAWMALYSPAGALLGQSTDVPAQALAANTVLTHAFTSPIVIPTTGVYFAAIMIQATTVPTLVGKVHGVNATGIGAAITAWSWPSLAQNSGSALTTTAPATIATPTNQTTIPYVALR
jgi:hypothetical protein